MSSKVPSNKAWNGDPGNPGTVSATEQAERVTIVSQDFACDLEIFLGQDSVGRSLEPS